MKKLVSLLLALLLLAVLLTACGKTQEPLPTPVPETPAPTPEPAPATISTGPSTHSTALLCSSFKSSRIVVTLSIIAARNYKKKWYLRVAICQIF